MSNELIHDVEESLKQERLHALWREYGPYLIAGVVLAVLFTALISGYRSWQYKVNTANTALLIQAMGAEDVVNEIEAVEADLRPGQRAVAWLSQAGIYLNENQPQKAWETVQAAAADTSLPQPYRALAQLEAVRIGWGETLGDKTPAQYLSDLEPLYSDRSNPWRFHARYQAGLIAGEGLQDYEAAQGHLDIVATAPAAAPSLVQQARSLKSVYDIKAAKKAAQGEAAVQKDS